MEPNRYGVLNIGDAPFDGISTGCFSSFGAKTGIAANVSNGANYSFIRYQLNGNNLFIVDGDGVLTVGSNPRAVTELGALNIGSQYFSGVGQFLGSTSGTYLAINALSSFTGNMIDLQVSGSSKLSVSATGAINKYAGSTPTNGQLLIGNTTNGNFSLATLSAGAGVTINNTPGAISIAATATGASDPVGSWARGD